MKKFAFILLFLMGIAHAQNTTTYGTINTGAATCLARNCVYYQVPPNTPWVNVSITGTWSGTITIQSVNSQTATYQNLNSQTWTLLATDTANIQQAVATGTSTFILVTAPSWTSGSASVSMTASASGTPLMNPIFSGTEAATGIVAPNGGSSSNCWLTNGSSGSCASASVNCASFPGTYTDQGAQINACITSLGTHGGIAYLPAQNYTINTQVVVPSNVWLEGQGKDATVLVGGATLQSGCANLYTSCAPIRILGTAANPIKNVHISDLTVMNGTPSTYSGATAGWDGIRIDYAAGVLMERLHVTSIQGSFGVAVKASKEVKFVDSEIDNYNYAGFYILQGNDHIWVERNKIGGVMCNNAAAAFTGTISGTVLSASSVTGFLGVGTQLLTGVTGTPIITAFVSGTNGGAGNYTLSSSYTVSSPTAMTSGSSCPNNNGYTVANGSDGSSTSFGYIVGTLLTITSVNDGAIAPGNNVVAVGLPQSSPYDQILSNGTGSGGVGTYNITCSNGSSYSPSYCPAYSIGSAGSPVPVYVSSNSKGASAPYSTNIWVDHNYFHDVPGWECLDSHGGQHIWFTDNTMQNCASGINESINAAVLATPIPTSDIHVLRNKVSQCAEGVTGCQAYQMCTNCWGLVAAGSANNGINYTVNDVEIEGNTFNGFGGMPSSQQTAFSGQNSPQLVGVITYYNTKNTNIVNNTFYNWNTVAILAYNNNLNSKVWANTAYDIAGQCSLGTAFPPIYCASSLFKYSSDGNYGVNLDFNKLMTTSPTFVPNYLIIGEAPANQITLGPNNTTNAPIGCTPPACLASLFNGNQLPWGFTSAPSTGLSGSQLNVKAGDVIYDDKYKPMYFAGGSTPQTGYSSFDGGTTSNSDVIGGAYCTAGTNTLPYIVSTGTGATGTLTVGGGGTITGITLGGTADGGGAFGSGYPLGTRSTQVTITDSTGSYGTGALATATVNSLGQITALNLISGGTGYTSPTVQITGGLAVPPGVKFWYYLPEGMNITLPGCNSGISVPTYVSGGGTLAYAGSCLLAASGGGGTGAQLTMNTAYNAFSSFTVSNYGSGYTSEPTTWTYVSGSGCSGTVTTTGGALTTSLNAIITSDDGTTITYSPAASATPATISGTGPSAYNTQITYQQASVSTYSGGGGTVSSFSAPSGSWPTWLVPTVTNSTTTPSLAVAASTIPTSAIGTGTPAAGAYVDGAAGAWTALPFKSLTTTGSSGAATLISGVLNIPSYTGGGTTTNALTMNASNTGATPGTTFNGASAQTISTNTIGAPGLAVSNTYTGTTTNDFSGTSQFKLPVATSYASAANGEIGYNTTNTNWHLWVNGADDVIATLGAINTFSVNQKFSGNILSTAPYTTTIGDSTNWFRGLVLGYTSGYSVTVYAGGQTTGASNAEIGNLQGNNAWFALTPAATTVAGTIPVYAGTNGLLTDSNVTLTNPATAATLTLANNSTLTTSGAYSWGLTTPGAYTYTFPALTSRLMTDGATGTTTAGLVPLSTTTAGVYSPSNILFTNPGSQYTYGLPGATDTLAGLGTTQTFTGTDSFTNSILPTTAGTPSLGSATKWWNSLYFGSGASYYVQLLAAAPSASYTLTIPTLTANSTAVVSNSSNVVTVSAAGNYTLTVPATGTVGLLGINNTWTGTQTWTGYSNVFSSTATATNAVLKFTGNPVASAYSTWWAGAPQVAGTSTTSFPMVAIGNTGTAVTSWSAVGTLLGFMPATGFTGNDIDVHAVNGGASAFTVNYQGEVQATGYGNETSLTVAAGAAAGSSPTIACATNYICGWNGGTINLLTGTSTTATGVLFTVTDTITHTKYPSCIYQIFPASSSYVPNAAPVSTYFPTNTSYTVETLNEVTTALTASSYYVINYTCIGQ